MLRYDISPLDPEAHLFIVGITIPEPTADEQILTLPSWISGSYLIRDFAGCIQKEEAYIGETPVPIAKLDKHTWRVSTAGHQQGQDLFVYYQVWAFDESVRTAYLDECRGFFNPGAVFMKVEGVPDTRLLININPPVDDMHIAANEWKVATGLKRSSGTQPFSWGLYEASCFDELIDCPVELSDFTVLSFDAYGTEHHLVFNNLPVNFDAQRVVEDIQKICEYEISFFEPQTKQAPVSDFTFLINVTSAGYGGLEHRNSTALATSGKSLPSVHDQKRTKHYIEFLGLVAHEYFHTWNVKRIKPAEFIDIDFSQEVCTTLLWLFEGFTSYYDDLILRRCGLIDDQTYADLLTKNFQSVLETNAAHVQSLAQASFDAWIKFYRPSSNTVNANVSYYRQGALAALVFDAVIRTKTKNSRCLDDVMRALWTLFKQAGTDYAGVTDSAIYDIFSDATGIDLTDLIDSLTQTSTVPNYAKYIKPLGIKLEPTPRKPLRAILGISGTASDAGFTVKNVYEHEAAQWAGLAPGDLIIALDGIRVKNDNIEELLSRYGEGDEIVIHAFRDDALMAWTLLIGRSADVCSTVKLKPTSLGKLWLSV